MERVRRELCFDQHKLICLFVAFFSITVLIVRFDTVGLAQQLYAIVNAQLETAAEEFDLPPILLKAIAYQESQWKQFGYNPQRSENEKLWEDGRQKLIELLQKGGVWDQQLESAFDLNHPENHVSLRVESVQESQVRVGLGIMQVTVDAKIDNLNYVKNLIINTQFNIEEGARCLLEKWKLSQQPTEATKCLPADDSHIIENWWYATYFYNGEGEKAKNYAERIVQIVSNPEEAGVSKEIKDLMGQMGWTSPWDSKYGIPGFKLEDYFSACETEGGGKFIYFCENGSLCEKSAPIHRWKDLQASRVVVPIGDTIDDYEGKITQEFANYLSTYQGNTYNGYHGGEDIGVSAGTPVRAIAPGYVVKISDLGTLGKLVAIKHRGTFVIPGKSATVNAKTYGYDTERITSVYSVYVHIQENSNLILGRYVEEGQMIGTVAELPSLGAHLHFEIRHPDQDPSCNWSLVGEPDNWSTFPGGGYNGYYEDPQLMVNAGLRDPSDFLKANSLPRGVRIAVTYEGYDRMQKVLDAMGRKYTTINPGILSNYDSIKAFDMIFINCADGLESIAANSSQSLRRYVEEGGVLYASDYAFAFLKEAFPDYVDFIGYAGQVGYVEADVVDPGLAEYLGINTVTLHFDLPAWVPIKNISDAVKIYLEGEIVYSGARERKPIAVGFHYGKGSVVFTSFHNAAQGELAAKLMEYLALLTITEDLAKENKEILEGEGYEVTKDARGMIDQGQTLTYVYKAQKGETFKIILNWPRFLGVWLKLAVYDPVGALYDFIEGSVPPISLTVMEAKSTYTYEITGLNLPYDNFEFAVAVGRSLDTTSPSAPVISSPTHPNQDEWYNNDDPTFNWTEPDDPSGIAGYSYVLDQEAGTVPDTTIDTTERTKSYTDVADGIWYFHVRAQDGAGNWGSASHYRIKIRTVFPTAEITFPEDGAAISGTVNITGTASGDDFDYYMVEYGEGESPSTWTLLHSSRDPVTQGTLASWDTTQVSDGEYTIRLSVIDTYAYVVEVRVTVLVDNTPPIIQDVLPIEGDFVPTKPIISATLTDNLSGIDENAILIKLNGNEVDPAPNFDPDTGKMTWTAQAPLPDGDYEVTIDVKDKAGNQAQQARTSFTISSEPAIKNALNYPNPCSSGTTFTYNLSREAQVRIEIYTLAGELIKVIDPASGEVGYNEQYWDGTDDRGYTLDNGVYIYRIVAEADGKVAQAIGKLVILR